MTKKQRVLNALGVLKEDAPELYGGLINGECPHEAGLGDVNHDLCGIDSTASAFTMGYCEECWRIATEGTA